MKVEGREEQHSKVSHFAKAASLQFVKPFSGGSLRMMLLGSGCSKQVAEGQVMQVMQLAQVQRWEQEEEAGRRSAVAGVLVEGGQLSAVASGFWMENLEVGQLSGLWAEQQRPTKRVSCGEDLTSLGFYWI